MNQTQSLQSPPVTARTARKGVSGGLQPRGESRLARRWVRTSLSLLLVLAWSAGLPMSPPMALAQQKKPAPPALAKLAEGLLRSDLDDRLETVTGLRKNPDGAREAIAYLLDKLPSAKAFLVKLMVCVIYGDIISSTSRGVSSYSKSTT